MKAENRLTYLITDGSLNSQNFSNKSQQLIHTLEFAAKAGVSLIQIREKQLPVRQVFELTLQIVKFAQHSNTKILLNDRADLALAAGADGVHLTTNSLSSEIIRQNFPKKFIIGVSAHSLEKVQRAKEEGADFATFSPIFPTASKEQYGAPQGIEKLKEVIESVGDFPIIALGGINQDNCLRPFQVGAKGIAGISLFSNDKNIAGAMQRINCWGGKNE